MFDNTPPLLVTDYLKSVEVPLLNGEKIVLDISRLTTIHSLRKSKKECVEKLTGREKDVLRGIVRGYTSPEISRLLTISTRTVESHRYNLMHKLGYTTRYELVQYAKENGYD